MELKIGFGIEDWFWNVKVWIGTLRLGLGLGGRVCDSKIKFGTKSSGLGPKNLRLGLEDWVCDLKIKFRTRKLDLEPKS